MVNLLSLDCVYVVMGATVCDLCVSFFTGMGIPLVDTDVVVVTKDVDGENVVDGGNVVDVGTVLGCHDRLHFESSTTRYIPAPVATYKSKLESWPNVKTLPVFREHKE